jgi:uncharacterized Zn-binding protein involved in type VI secretion
VINMVIGGSVVSGASQSEIDGTAITCVGDGAICKIHGSVVIVAGE